MMPSSAICDRGYGPRLGREDAPPPDPDAEAKRANAMKVVGALIEERARLGLLPIFPANRRLIEARSEISLGAIGPDGRS